MPDKQEENRNLNYISLLDQVNYLTYGLFHFPSRLCIIAFQKRTGLRISQCVFERCNGIEKNAHFVLVAIVKEGREGVIG